MKIALLVGLLWPGWSKTWGLDWLKVLSLLDANVGVRASISSIETGTAETLTGAVGLYDIRNVVISVTHLFLHCGVILSSSETTNLPNSALGPPDDFSAPRLPTFSQAFEKASQCDPVDLIFRLLAPCFRGIGVLALVVFGRVDPEIEIYVYIWQMNWLDKICT